MTGPLAAARDFFVAPSRVPAPAVAPAPAGPASFAVLGGHREALAVAGGLVLGRGTGVVCVWPARGLPAPLPRTARAGRLAARLEARDLAAVASGRLVWVALPDEPAAAVAAAQRALATADVPSAVVVAGPRDPDLDVLLELQDAVVVAGRTAGDAVVDLAVAGLSQLPAPVSVIPVPGGPAARLAAAGILVAPGLRAALAPALAAAR